MVLHEFKEGADLLELLSPGNRLCSLVPIDEAGIVELGQVRVMKLEGDGLHFVVIVAELHGLELLPAAGVVFHECYQDTAPGRVGERSEDLIQVDDVLRWSAVDWGHWVFGSVGERVEP